MIAKTEELTQQACDQTEADLQNGAGGLPTVCPFGAVAPTYGTRRTTAQVHEMEQYSQAL